VKLNLSSKHCTKTLSTTGQNKHCWVNNITPIARLYDHTAWSLFPITLGLRWSYKKRQIKRKYFPSNWRKQIKKWAQHPRWSPKLQQRNFQQKPSSVTNRKENLKDTFLCECARVKQNRPFCANNRLQYWRFISSQRHVCPTQHCSIWTCMPMVVR